jgi:hypothetical protein
MKEFPYQQAVQFGWEKTKSNLGFLILVMIIVAVINIIPDGIQNSLPDDLAVIVLLVGLVGWGINQVIQMGLIQISLKLNDEREAKFSDLFPFSEKTVNYIIGSILYGLIVIVGTILLIVPGIIWALKFQFYGYYIVDKNLKPVDALKMSAMSTSGKKGNLFVFFVLLGLINFLGLIALLVGLLISVPVTLLAYVYVYRLLMKEVETQPVPEKFNLSFK